MYTSRHSANATESASFPRTLPSSGGDSERGLSETLGNGLDDAVVFDVVGVVGLEFGGNARESALEGLLGGSVDHLGLWEMG